MGGRVAGGTLLCVLLLALPTGCTGGEGGGSGERPTLSPTFSPTRTLPSPTRTPTRTNEPPDQPTREPVERPTDERTEAPPATDPAAPSPTEASSATPESAAPEEEASVTEEPAEEGVPAWAWWLLAGLVVVTGALAWLLLARTRRRRARDEQLAGVEADVAWFARELLPQLRASGSIERVAGGWQVARPRVVDAEDRLTVLQSTATEAGAARARSLRDAVRTSRARVDGLTAAGPHDTWALDLDDEIARLESALAPREERT